MKTENILLSLALFICQISGAQSKDLDKKNAIVNDEHIIAEVGSDATPDYYTGKTTVYGKTIAYAVERSNKYYNDDLVFHRVYNKCNELPARPSRNGIELVSGQLPFIATDSEVLRSIVRSCIPAAKIQAIGNGGDLDIIMWSDPGTGRVLEVEFEITARTHGKGYSGKDARMISPEELEDIEKAIKERIIYEVPDKCKDQSFIKTGCMVHFSCGVWIVQ